jgi:hypothetical protein
MKQTHVSSTALSQVTYRYDCLRGLFQGLLDAAWMTFLVLIAIRCFNASATIKACIVSAGFWGYFCNPVMMKVAKLTGFKNSTLAGLYYIASGLLMLLAASTPYLWVYTSLVIVWQFVSCQVGPIMIQTYAENYEKHERGQRCSTTFLFAAIMGSVFSYCGGRLLDSRLAYYSWILIAIGLGSFMAAFFVMKIPSNPLKMQSSGNIRKSLSLFWKDKLFGWISLAWTLMSLGQWMISPLRIEYMANPQYGCSASNKEIAIITFIVPAISQIVSLKVWGYAFDKINFIFLRIIINLCAMLGILIFFHSTDLLVLGIATALMGFSSGGSMLTSNIWVTKIATKENVSSYMSAHVWVSGLRGLLAPFLGFFFLAKTNPHTVSYVVNGVGLLSIAMFLWAKSHHRMQA